MLGKSLVPCVLMLGKSLVWAEAPVSPQSLNDQSAWLKGEADKADVNNPLVKAVLGNGFQYFEQDASTATYKYSADKSEALVPFIQQIVGATDAVKDDVAASIIGAEWVTDGGGVKWNHHTLLYTATDAGSKGSNCNYATFIVRIPKEDPDQRELFLFHQKTTFSLAPDVIFLRKCHTSAGFLGIGKHTHCWNVPKNIPHSLDEASLEVLQDYLTAVALKSLSSDIPVPNAAIVAPTFGSGTASLPEEFIGTLKALEIEIKEDIKKVSDANTTSTSEVVKELLSNGFTKWQSSLTMQTLSRISPIGAPRVLDMLTKSSIAGQSPKVQKEIEDAFAGILNASEPLVYSALGCTGDNTCSYLFLMGRTDNVTHTTDLVEVRQNAPFKLAPKLIVVRETTTKHHPWGNSTSSTDKVKEVPRKVTDKDLEGILAFFQITVVNKLSATMAKIVV